MRGRLLLRGLARPRGRALIERTGIRHQTVSMTAVRVCACNGPPPAVIETILQGGYVERIFRSWSAAACGMFWPCGYGPATTTISCCGMRGTVLVLYCVDLTMRSFNPIGRRGVDDNDRRPSKWGCAFAGRQIAGQRTLVLDRDGGGRSTGSLIGSRRFAGCSGAHCGPRDPETTVLQQQWLARALDRRDPSPMR